VFDFVGQAFERLVTVGGFGYLIAVIEAGAIYFLHKQLLASWAKLHVETIKIIESREEMVKSLNANALAIEGYNKAMEARTRANEALDRTLADLARQSEFHDERFLEALRDLKSQLSDGIKRAESIERAVTNVGRP
jgi:hypothetical protein